MATVADPTAVMGRRIGATFIDGLVIFVPTGIATWASFDTLTQAQREQLPSSVSDADTFCDRYTDLHTEDSGFCFVTGDTVHYSDGDWVVAFSLCLYGLAFLVHVVLQSITGATIGSEDVATVLGLVGRDLLLDAVQAVADEDAKAAFALAGRAVEMGYDLRLVCRELSRVVRDLLVLVRGKPVETLPSSGRDLLGVARALGYPAVAQGQFLDDYRHLLPPGEKTPKK